MTTTLVQPEARPVTPDELTLIKNTVAVGATDAELKLFLFDCSRQGVHPLDRLIHFTKRKGKYAPITSIDFMRIRAADTGEMAGSDDPTFRVKPSGDVLQLDAATVTVYRLTQGQRFAYSGTARWAEYYPGDGDVGFMWRKMPHTMLGKCAEAIALRKGFPRQLAGLYAKEEMDQADAPEPRNAVPTVTTARDIRTESWQKVLADAKRDIPEPAPEAETVDTETGEVLPTGFALIDDYKIDGDNGEWHHITWGKDAQGGAMVYKTKLAKIANQAREAYNDRVAVKLHAKKMPYLDRVERLDGQDGTMSKAAIAATKWNPDDLDKQGF